MPDSRIYLNVPFAQKDEAKALGARWDAVQKKWFVSADKDITLFVRWHTEPGAMKSPRSKTAAAKTGSPQQNSGTGVKTYAAAKDFVAYDGDAPPWV